MNPSERKAYGNGILWAVFAILLSMSLVYAVGETPNPFIVIGTLGFGLWYRFGGQ